MNAEGKLPISYAANDPEILGPDCRAAAFPTPDKPVRHVCRGQLANAPKRATNDYTGREAADIGEGVKNQSFADPRRCAPGQSLLKWRLVTRLWSLGLRLALRDALRGFSAPFKGRPPSKGVVSPNGRTSKSNKTSADTI